MSAFVGKADVIAGPSASLLTANSGHAHPFALPPNTPTLGAS